MQYGYVNLFSFEAVEHIIIFSFSASGAPAEHHG